MIADPMPIDSWFSQNLAAKQGELVFCGNQNILMYGRSSLHYPINNRYGVDWIWQIVANDGFDTRYYLACYNGSGRERFIDWISNNDPDHFEWLLFHPEWL